MPSKYPVLNNRPIDQWRVTELKEELKRRKLITRGLKEDLVKRLNEAIENDSELLEQENMDNSGSPDPTQEDEDNPDPLSEHQITEDLAEVVKNKNLNLETDSIVIDNDPKNSASDTHVEEVATTADLNVAVEEICPEVSLENSSVESHVLNSQSESIGQVSACVENTNKKNDEMNDQKNDEMNDEKNAEMDDEKNDEVNKEKYEKRHVEKNEELNIEKNKELNVEKNEEMSNEKNEEMSFEKNNEMSNEKNEEMSFGKNNEMSSEKNKEMSFEKNEDMNNKGDNVMNDEKMDEKSDEENDEANEEKNDEMDGKNGEINYEMNDKKNDTKDSEYPTVDVNLNKPELNNQVSEVKSDFGFQVSYESISTASVSINEKNELKDNLNADNLEIGVVKPEIVLPSSCDVAPIGGDLHPLDNIQEPAENQGSHAEVDDVTNALCEDLGKKNDVVDGGYSEKLNLDRSSGDESMEEDVLESKQVESNANPDVVEGSIEIEEPHLREPSQLAAEGVGLSFEKKDAVEGERMPLTAAEKRKTEEKDSLGNNEPSKRQRRWSSETPKVAEQKLTNLISSGTPKSLNLSTPKPSFTRSDSALGEDFQKERTVPPSQKPPTNSLRIDRFLRPFTLKAVRELLGKTGTVCSFWMDNIKTHCFVMYSSEEEAVETRNAVYNLQWPPNGGRLLTAEFVDPEEVKMRVEAPPDSPAPISPNPSAPQQKQSPQSHLRQSGLRQQQPEPASLPPPPPLSDPPLARERLLPPPPSKKPEPPILTLDDLFMKTKTTPRIYYLPLSEEQVASKASAQIKSSRG